MNWTEEQLQAIEKEGTNIIVSAGAGSGKTAVLSERVLRKVKDGIHVDELLILTFTNAAAKEMKERIRKKLIKNNYEEEVIRLEKAYITTFDAFALATVKKYHEVLNISQEISICDSVFLDIKIEKILSDILDEYYQKQDPHFVKFITDFCIKDDKEVQKNILTLYQKLQMRYDVEKYLENYIEKYYQESYVLEKCNEYEKLLKNKLEKMGDLLKELSLSLDNDEFSKYAMFSKLVESRNYDEMISSFSTTLPRVNKNYDEDAKETKNQLSSLLKELKAYFIYDSKNQMKEEILSTKDSTTVLVSILQELNKRVDICKKNEQLYTFTDIFKLAIKLVEKYPDVRNGLAMSFNEIMIDEYQDNNDLQEIFIDLIARNNVYMVGDIKQSIYRFRNANPNIFKRKYDKYSKKEDGIKIDLNRNFRSREEVLSDINLLFNELMDIEIGGADYKESHQMIFGNKSFVEQGKTNENYHLEILEYQESEDRNISKEEQEIFLICQDIKKKIEDKFQIFDKDLNRVRPIQYSDIVILLDKSKYFDLYKKIFEYFQIPLSVYKDESLKSGTDIFMINHILKLVFKIKENSFDTSFRYSFLSIARSYLFRLTDEEIFEYFAKNNFYNSVIYEKASMLATLIDEESPLDFYHHLLDIFEVEKKLITTQNIKASRIRLEYFYNMLSSLTKLGYTIYDFSEYLDTLYEGDYDLRFSLNKEEEDSCKIMTIHKSKGLEFPICYFASFTSKFNLRDLNDRFLYDDTYQLIIPSTINGIKPTIYKQLLKVKILREEIGEKIRLLYVALTRCCEKMIIVVPNKELTDKSLVKEDYRSFMNMLDSIHEMITPYIRLQEVAVTKDYLKNQSLVKKIDQSNLKLEVEKLSLEKKVIEQKKYSKENLELLSREKYELLKFGTKVHEILEFIDFKDPDYTGIDPQIATKIDRFLKQEIIKQNLDATFYHEYEFVMQDNAVIYHGIIDLLIETKNKIIIVDYKLKNIDDDKYKDQLYGYKEVMRKKSCKNVSCYLYSIMDETLTEI